MKRAGLRDVNDVWRAWFSDRVQSYSSLLIYWCGVELCLFEGTHCLLRLLPFVLTTAVLRTGACCKIVCTELPAVRSQPQTNMGVSAEQENNVQVNVNC